MKHVFSFCGNQDILTSFWSPDRWTFWSLFLTKKPNKVIKSYFKKPLWLQLSSKRKNSPLRIFFWQGNLTCTSPKELWHVCDISLWTWYYKQFFGYQKHICRIIESRFEFTLKYVLLAQCSLSFFLNIFHSCQGAMKIEFRIPNQ